MARPARRHITTEPEAQASQDAADDEPEAGPLRRCIVTRERLPKERMIRFVLGPDRAVVPDLAANLPGRGFWLSARGDVLEASRAQGGSLQATLGRAFARAARGPVKVPPDLPDLLETALIRRLGELLGLARRAGQAVAGFDKAREWLRIGRARLIVQASDGSAAERARFLTGAEERVAVVEPLTAAALGRVFGRDHVVHIAVAPGRLAELIAVEAERLSGLRRVEDGPAPGDSSGENGLNDGRVGPGHKRTGASG